MCLIVYLSSGLLDPEPLTEVDEEMVSEVDLYNTVTDEEREEILSELTKVVPPVSTFHLSVFQCLAWHVDRVGFRKRCLGDRYILFNLRGERWLRSWYTDLSHIGKLCWTMGERYINWK